LTGLRLKGKKIVVVGLAKTGVALCRFLTARGAEVTVTDKADEAELEDAIGAVRPLGVGLELGGHRTGTFESCDLVVISPGVPHTLAPITLAREKGIPVIGEIELASRFISEPITAITGTNGKTTTTTLIGDMLSHSGVSVFVGGNIGTPLISYLDCGKKADVIVIEISSFQLDTIDSFRPSVGVLLNVTPDHLDRYADFDHYLGSKFLLFKNQGPEDVAVINASDHRLRAEMRKIVSKKWTFGFSEGFPERGGTHACIDDASLRVSLKCRADSLSAYDLSCLSMKGRHNLENATAAILASLASGGTREGIESALKQFKGLPHRLETVAVSSGIEFVNDSKATNVDAAVKAIESFSQPLILILGGRDKDGNFSDLKEAVKSRVKRILLIGEARDKIADQLRGLVAMEMAESMEEAVYKAFKAGETGDVVLLAPACASFDMFDNYAHRGEVFRHAVLNIDRKR
jgi:UDP-N-acetylmuramoylalanine--D-glutamate ligase